MHKEILTKEQIWLFPLLRKISKDFGLVGGTAVALQVGHRRSVDFDLFSHKPFRNIILRREIKNIVKIDQVFINKDGEFTFISDGVKITFFHYPFKIIYSENLDTIIKMPDLITLAAMKAYALGKRAKWKDYVDLYYIMKDYHPMGEITKKGKEIFGNEFNEKMFRVQLSYFEDINYGEKIEFLPGFEVSEEKVKKELIEFSLG